jgi:solute carrier family 13 (sodium-dependent dicarboxylate transporter), member 2/3/5
MMRYVALVGGPLVLGVTLVFPHPAGLPQDAWRVAGIAGWMAVWWLAAVVPLEATALLPIALLPLTGVADIDAATASYADPIIFLFLGGFLLAATLERWDLHKRFALATVSVAGTAGPRVVLAFMAASAALSMWISNTATAVMMLPIAKAVAGGMASGDHEHAKASRAFSTALFLGVAYGCSIGGLTTLVGTPPNAIFAAAARELVGIEVGFGSWIGIGILVSVPMFFACWILLTRLFKVHGEVPGLAGVVERERAALAPMAGAERYILAVFGLTALAWILRAPKIIGGVRIPGLMDLFPAISDAGIAIAASVVLLTVPLRRSRFSVALDWRTASRVPWGILLLFGGGLSLAAAFAESGLTEALGRSLQSLRGVPSPVIILVTVTLFVLMTEMTSNAATTALGMPLMVGVANGLGVPPLPLMVAATLSASMAFMLPVATPPNAIVFGSGLLRSQDMAKAGVWLNVIAVAVITTVVLMRL